MPISATGSSARESGFTLVELMVVLVIIGIMSAAVIIALPDPRGRVSDNAETLAARLVTARDLAIVAGRDIGVSVTATGYSFAERRDDGWQPAPQKPLQPALFGEAITAAAPAEPLVFDATGLATPAVITLQRGAEQARVAVDGNGGVRVQ